MPYSEYFNKIMRLGSRINMQNFIERKGNILNLFILERLDPGGLDKDSIYRISLILLPKRKSVETENFTTLHLYMINIIGSFLSVTILGYGRIISTKYPQFLIEV